MLEPYEAKVSRTVLRREGGSNLSFLFGESIIAQLLYLEAQEFEGDIRIYINSPGGVITPGLAIYDTMQCIKGNVATICVGQAASMAAILLAGGTKGKRMAFPNARMLIHQPLGGAQGQASDISRFRQRDKQGQEPSG